MQFYFITGTSSGIGKALAEEILLRENVCVYGISRTAAVTHKNYRHIVADLSDPDQLHKIYTLFNQGYKPEDSLYLVNNAGMLDPIKHVGGFSENAIQKIMQVNLITPMQLINAFLNIPNPASQTRVVLSVSSGAAAKVIDGWSLYGSAKGALDHFSLHAVKELEMTAMAHCTRIFSVAPGVVDTPMQEKIRNTKETDFSTVERFIALKKNDELVAANVVAHKYLYILDEPHEFPETVFSVRNIN